MYTIKKYAAIKGNEEYLYVLIMERFLIKKQGYRIAYLVYHLLIRNKYIYCKKNIGRMSKKTNKWLTIENREV